MNENAKPRVLIIDDSRDDRQMIAAFISDTYRCDQASSGKEALDLIEGKYRTYHAILLDIEFEDGEDGFAILEKLARACGDVPVVMVTKFNEVEKIVKAVKLGAVHYVHKGDLAVTLKVAIEKAMQEADLRRARALSRGTSEELWRKFIGRNSKIAAIRGQIEKYARSDKPVLITGETGTGKDVCARLVHALSARRDNHYGEVICGERAASLIEDDLFGHMPGAFTGALGKREGAIRKARGGSLFLNEIGDVDYEIQVKLLRLVEQKQYRPLGSDDDEPADVRYILATRRNLEDMIKSGRFRDDLYYRINFHRIHIPPLRERREDIPLLAEHFIRESARECERAVPKASEDVLEALSRFEWRGNVRELQSLIYGAVFSLQGDQLHLRDIMKRPSVADTNLPFRAAQNRFKEEYFRNLMIKCDRNVGRVAELAEVTERSVYSVISKFKI